MHFFYQFILFKDKYNDMQIMNERLLASRADDLYDPFQSPPSIQKAENHQKAMSVGIDLDQQDDSRVCPCCQNIIQKQLIPLTCNDEQLLFLGIGYPLFYKLTRYIAIIITAIFIISGSGFYFLITIKCQSHCIYFFGVPIINLQMPVSQSLQITDIVNVITSFVILVVVLFIKSQVQRDIHQLQSKVNSPEQYTIIVQNLPEDASQQEINQWCKVNFGYKPILINYAYNVNQLAETYAKRHNLTININKLIISMNDQEDVVDSNRKKNIEDDIKEKRKQIVQYDKILNNYKQENIPCRKLGTVFLTFSKQKIVNEILQKYSSSFINSLISNLLVPFKKPPLSFGNMTTIINRAPAPREVIWRNLSFSFFRSVVAEILFFSTMIFIIFLAFQLQFRVMNYAYSLRIQSVDTGQTIVLFQALFMSLIVVILNSLLRLVIKFFASVKRYYSYTSYHSSFCFYYSLMYSLNTCFMIYIVHGHLQTSTSASIPEDHVLLYDIHLIMLANAFSEPLFKLLEPIMWGRVIWKNYIKSIKKQKNPYTQSYVNSLWEGYEISNADNYQYIYRILIVTTWYAHSAPLGVILSLIALFLDYWIGKYLLLRVYKRPQNISKQIASPIIMSLELMPLIYICGVLQFTYKVSNSQNIFAFLTQFFSYGLTTSVLLISILGYLVFVKPKKGPVSQQSYSEMEVMFPYNYETENPITKLKGQIKYLYGVLRRGTNRNDTKIIGELLAMKRKSIDDLAQRQSEIVKIKKKNLKKASTISLQMKDFRNSKHSQSSG